MSFKSVTMRFNGYFRAFQKTGLLLATSKNEYHCFPYINTMIGICDWKR